MLALSFARSVAPVAFALRFSVLPLIDSIMQLTADKDTEAPSPAKNKSVAEEVCEIERSATDLQRFTATLYFERELQRSGTSKAATN